MSVYGMKPVFVDRDGYLEWRKVWSLVFGDLSNRIRETKRQLVISEKAHDVKAKSSLARKLHEQRVMARKLLTVLDEGKARANKIVTMRRELKQHQNQFPLSIDDARVVEFHFNKKHLEFSWVPMWVVKTKGQSYYVNHVDATAPWTTRENPDHASTKGSIRVRNCNLHITQEGNAILSSNQAVE